MKQDRSVLQVCTTCKLNSELPAETDSAPEGFQLFEALKDAIEHDASLNDAVVVRPVECMNGCASSCTVALRSEGKYQFVIGALDASDDRIADMVSFAKSYVQSDKGLPAWRDRPVHIRKNTLTRLHPIPSHTADEN